jgi:hypothetical protein
MAHPLWSLPLEAAARGIALAREAQRLLVWTDTNWLFWTNRKGERQAQAHFESPLVAAVSDDGSAFLAADAEGRVSLLAPDFKVRWERQVNGKPVAAALDPLGLVAAVATNLGQICLFHADGEPAREATCPRPAQHLAFVPGTAALIAAADLGWMAAFDLEKGEWLWRDAPVATIGGLAVAGIGEPILLACFSDGLRGYRADGKPWKFASATPACRSVVVSYNAEVIVTYQLDGSFAGWTVDMKPHFSYQPEAPPVSLALSALGESLYLAQADRQLVAVALEG